jgi:hypothetical protein
MGGNIAITTNGTMIVDNRTYWPTDPSQITFSLPADEKGGCGDPVPCSEY